MPMNANGDRWRGHGRQGRRHQILFQQDRLRLSQLPHAAEEGGEPQRRDLSAGRHRQGAAAIKAKLKTGVPVLVGVVYNPSTAMLSGGELEVTRGGGHTVLIVGCNDGGTKFLYIDPYPKSSHLRYEGGMSDLRSVKLASSSARSRSGTFTDAPAFCGKALLASASWANSNCIRPEGLKPGNDGTKRSKVGLARRETSCKLQLIDIAQFIIVRTGGCMPPARCARPASVIADNGRVATRSYASVPSARSCATNCHSSIGATDLKKLKQPRNPKQPRQRARAANGPRPI